MRNIILFSFLFLTFSTSLYSQSNVSDNFVVSTNQVYQIVVRIFGESTIDKVKEYMAESFVNDKNQVYSVGTGFIISSDGLIATAYHVVAPITKEIIVEHAINNQLKQYIGTLVNYDKHADIALIKVDANDLPFVNLFDPIDLPVGKEIGFIGFSASFSIFNGK
jgi:S1-C subfamily serine protease